jgi:hypothetical protein
MSITIKCIYFLRMKLLVNSKTINLSLLDTKTAHIISKSKEFSSLLSTWGGMRFILKLQLKVLN